jgi:hypothetical protein
MKKLLLTFLFCLFFTSNAVADLPPPFRFPWETTQSQTQTPKTVIITNLDDYPDLILFQLNDSRQPKEVKNNEQLDDIYPYAHASAQNSLIAIKKSVLANAGGFDKINWTEVLLKKAPIYISLSDYIEGNPDLSERVFKYKINVSTENNVTLKLSEVTFKYKNRASKVLTF